MATPSAAYLAREAEVRAVSLLKSLKGIADARVDADASGRIMRVQVLPAAGVDERQAVRNVQSGLLVVLGEYVDVSKITIAAVLAPMPETGHSAPVVVAPAPAPVLELKSTTARKSDLNEAAKVAFETLRAAQSSFHAFQFDGAELVRINGTQYVVVAVKRADTEVRHCGGAPVTDSVGSASARALMNAVGAAAMNSVQLELHSDDQYELLKA